MDFTGKSRLNRALSISLIVAILAVTGYLVYLLASPKPSEKFTEFYLLGVSGKTEDYPKQAVAGKPVDLVLGIISHEQQTASYRVEIRVNSQSTDWLNIGTLATGQKLEETIHFTIQQTGEKQRVEFYLYQDNSSQPYFKDPLRLYLDVTPPQG